MKKLCLLLILAICYTTSFSQENLVSDTTWAESSPVIDYAREVINKLCDKSMNGRGIAKGGDKTAADYILTEMRSIGVMPIGDDYFQKVPVNANIFPGKMSLIFNKDKASLKAGEDFWVDPTSAPALGEFKLTYITRKQLNDPLVRMDKLRDAKEGFLLIDNIDKSGESADLTKKIDLIINKIKTETEIQLKGVIIYDNFKLTWNSSNSQAPRTIIYVVKELEADKLKTAKIEIEAEYKTSYITQNVVGIIEGSSISDSAIVLTAHYDHLGTLGNDVFFPGANSNAAGVAMLLSLAKHFEMIHPKYSIIFIALGGEVQGLEGSKAYTNYPAIALSKTKFLINFDVIGTGIDGAKVVNGSILEPQFKLLNDINTRNKYLSKLEPRGEACISGHCMFHRKNVPCFSIYAMGGTVNYNNLDDTPENTPLTEFEDMYNLVIKFIERIK